VPFAKAAKVTPNPPAADAGRYLRPDVALLIVLQGVTLLDNT